MWLWQHGSLRGTDADKGRATQKKHWKDACSILYVLQGGNKHGSKYYWWGTLAGGPVVKNSPSKAGDMG